MKSKITVGTATTTAGGVGGRLVGACGDPDFGNVGALVGFGECCLQVGECIRPISAIVGAGSICFHIHDIFCWATDAAFVHRAVAVVVQTVADFRSGGVAGVTIIVAIGVVGDVARRLQASLLRNSRVAVAVVVAVGIPGRGSGCGSRAYPVGCCAAEGEVFQKNRKRTGVGAVDDCADICIAAVRRAVVEFIVHQQTRLRHSQTSVAQACLYLRLRPRHVPDAHLVKCAVHKFRGAVVRPQEPARCDGGQGSIGAVALRHKLSV